jgi:hypothetical protein
MDSSGSAPRPKMVRDMANILLAERNGPPVGTKWVYNYSLALSVLIKAAAAQIGKPRQRKFST